LNKTTACNFSSTVECFKNVCKKLKITYYDGKSLFTMETSIPGTDHRSIPGTDHRSIPGTDHRSIPGTDHRSIPGTDHRSIPGTDHRIC